jgi:hypothetical protein
VPLGSDGLPTCRPRADIGTCCPKLLLGHREILHDDEFLTTVFAGRTSRQNHLEISGRNSGGLFAVRAIKTWPCFWNCRNDLKRKLFTIGHCCRGKREDSAMRMHWGAYAWHAAGRFLFLYSVVPARNRYQSLNICLLAATRAALFLPESLRLKFSPASFTASQFASPFLNTPHASRASHFD